MPELATCDSAVIMYYHTPGNPISFNMRKVDDKKILSVIAQSINEKILEAKDSTICKKQLSHLKEELINLTINEN